MMKQNREKLKAFRFLDRATLIQGVTFEETPGRARSRVSRAARAAGYETRFVDVRIRRAPEYDRARFLGRPISVGATYEPEHLEVDLS